MERRGLYIEYWWESPKERQHQEDQDIGGLIILKWILRAMNWIDLARDKDQWRALVDTVINLWAPKEVWEVFE
jgi:hypothetical protein